MLDWELFKQLLMFKRTAADYYPLELTASILIWTAIVLTIVIVYGLYQW